MWIEEGVVNLVELLTKQCLISFPEKQEIQVKALPANPGLLCVCDSDMLSDPVRSTLLALDSQLVFL